MGHGHFIPHPSNFVVHSHILSIDAVQLFGKPVNYWKYVELSDQCCGWLSPRQLPGTLWIRGCSRGYSDCESSPGRPICSLSAYKLTVTAPKEWSSVLPNCGKRHMLLLHSGSGNTVSNMFGRAATKVFILNRDLDFVKVLLFLLEVHWRWFHTKC
jgi:hypothetical protein